MQRLQQNSTERSAGLTQNDHLFGLGPRHGLSRNIAVKRYQAALVLDRHLAVSVKHGEDRRHSTLRSIMSDTVYTADIRIDRIKGPYRHAWLPAHEGPVEFGVHGAIKEHYGADPDREITTTLDYVMAATGG
jgi:hypothetical protein